MIGRKLGHYTIVDVVGSGGMGEVYRARDERLERDVAVKVLRPGALADETARRRFRREALALSRINHPHIATVHDFDTDEQLDFLVMELVAGRPLTDRLASGPLPESEVIRLGTELARALAAAHEAGVIHRDLKPGNLRLTPEGELKVLDFGIARLLKPSGDMADATALPTLDDRGPLGTLPYMSPEQVRGAEADARSDVYAAGAILYEMATGRPLFPGHTGYELSEAIVRRTPPLPTTLNPMLSIALESVVLKAIDKDPARRYQSARELLAALEPLSRDSGHPLPAPAATRRRWLGLSVAAAAIVLAVVGFWLVGPIGRSVADPAASPIGSLAVLPLENLSRDPEQQYVADAITEALISDLAQISALRVISRTSVLQYAQSRKPLPEIARELNVDAVVLGAVLAAGNRIRITAQLVHAPTDRHLWANSYERVIEDVLALQRDVAQAIAAEVRVVLTPGERERLAATRRVDPAAYQSYIRGRHHWNRRTESDLRRAVDLFDDAVQREPTYALAYTGLADAYASLGFSFDVAALPPREALPKAKAAALRALELDDRSSEAHTSLAFITFLFDWDWATAERHFRRALEINPNYAHAHHWYSHYLLSRGRVDESLRHSQQALTLDPLSSIINLHLGWHYMYSGQHAEAVDQLRKTIELDPNYAHAHRYLALPFQVQGEFDKAIQALQSALRLLEDSIEIRGELGSAYAAAGRRADAERVLADLDRLGRTRYVSPYFAAAIHAGLGDRDAAFRWLDRAYDDRSDLLVYLHIEPRLNALRSDPRFSDLVRRVGLDR
jgi:TolB-like protein/Tfp pilus assembly protein PilF/tRNA A-37 threonylcarbamoyl transferase component Bud32